MAKTKGKKKSANKKAVTNTENTALSTNVNFGNDIGKGLEGTDKDSFAIPFLVIVQKMSPQVDEADPQYLEGAKPGMFRNTLNNELFDGEEGVIVLPCHFSRKFLKWGPKGSDNSGFKGEMTPEAAAKLEQDNEVVRSEGKLYYPAPDGKIKEKKCDTLNDTRNHFCLLFDKNTGEIQQVLLSLSSTQIKKSKQLVSLLAQIKVDDGNGNSVTPPTWANQVRLTTIVESNDKGKWHGIEITMEGLIQDQAVYNAGRDFNKICMAGDVNVNYNNAETSDKEF